VLARSPDGPSSRAAAAPLASALAAVTRLRQSTTLSQAVAARASDMERTEYFRSLGKQLLAGLEPFNPAFGELTETSGRFVAVQSASIGGISLAHVARFGLLETAAVPPRDDDQYPGLQACLNSGSTGYVEMFVIDAPRPFPHRSTHRLSMSETRTLGSYAFPC
jgi:hypothetical protein